MRKSIVLTLSLLLPIGSIALAENVAQMKVGPVPGLPTCATGSVQNGDPAKGPSIIHAKMAAGCTIPWHWHTPNENVMMVTGTARMEMKDGKPLRLDPGAYTLMPSHHVHQFSCAKGCTLYLYADAPFDIHYVNAGGSEISPDDAMKPLKETAAKPPM